MTMARPPVKRMSVEQLKVAFNATLEVVREARVQCIMSPGPENQKKLQAARTKLHSIATRLPRNS